MTTADCAAEAEDLATSLRRLEGLIAALDGLSDPRAREPARALLELVLDLHGLALARIAAMTVEASGPALLERLAADETVRAMLLLHGLHPEEAGVRIAKALAALPVRVELLHCDARRARLLVHAADHADRHALRAVIEAAIVEAAPELEEIVIEGLDVHEAGVDSVAALVG